jgi:competence ComEA-like helix-hairpin-helix protein
MKIKVHSRPSLISAFFLIFLLLTPFSPAIASQTNINTATKQELLTLPYIGEAKAAAIISHRQLHGPFTSPQDIQDVPGIGEKSFLILEPLIGVSNAPSQAHSKQTSPTSDREDPQATAQAIRTGQIMILTNQQYLPMLKEFIHNAQHRIDIGMYIFKVGTSDSNGPRQIMNELIRARKRGVKVSVVLENSSYSDSLNEDNGRVARILGKNHITVKFDSLKRTTHTKIVLIDGRFAFIGSHNFTHSALTQNNEITLLLDNPRVARDIQQYLTKIR